MKKDLEIEDDKLASLEAEVKRNMEREETAKGDSSSSQASVDAGSSDVEVRGSGDINTAINAGKRFIGNSVYSLGAMDPENGRFDCSGFVSWAYGDRKSTRLNSSHVSISYAVFCLKKKNTISK